MSNRAKKILCFLAVIGIWAGASVLGQYALKIEHPSWWMLLGAIAFVSASAAWDWIEAR